VLTAIPIRLIVVTKIILAVFVSYNSSQLPHEYLSEFAYFLKLILWYYLNKTLINTFPQTYPFISQLSQSAPMCP
jgi:hypothetical protein